MRKRNSPESSKPRRTPIKINERKSSRETPKQCEQKLKVMDQDSLDALVIMDKEGTIRYESPSGERILGYKPDELVGRSMVEFLHPDDVQNVVESFGASARDSGQTISMEVRFLHKDGSWRIVESVGNNPIEDTAINDTTINDRDISDRKQMQGATQDIASRYKAIFDNRIQMVYMHDEHGLFLDANDFALKQLGYTRNDLGKMSFQDIIHPDDLPQALEALDDILTKGFMEHPIEIRLITKSGEELWVETFDIPLENDADQRMGLGIAYDITERKSTEEQLQFAEEKYRSIFENSAVAITITDENENIVSWNKFAESLLGMEKEDLYMKPVRSLYPEAEWAKIKSQDMKRTGVRHHLETQIIRKDQEIIDVDLSLTILKGPDGEVVGSIGAMADITERKRTELELRESEERLKRYLENSPDVICVTNLRGKILYVNEANEKLTGYSREEMVGKNFLKLNLLAPGHVTKPDEWLDAGGKENTFRPDEYELVRKDGSRVFVEVSTFSICPDGQEDRTEIVAMVRDISDRKQMEAAIRDSEQQYSALVRNVPDAVFKYKEGFMTWANDRIEEMLGYTTDELVGQGADLFVSEETDLKQVIRVVDAEIRDRGHFHGTIKAKKKDGGTADIEYTASQIPGIYPAEIVGVARDITERKHAEEERERLNAELAEKNREQEQIIYVTSHDLRSPLVNVQGFSKELNYSLHELASILQEENVPSEVQAKLTNILESDIADALAYIQTSITKMDSLLSGLLRLSRLGRAALNFEKLDMNTLLLEIIKGFEYRIKETGANIEIGELPPCLGDAVQINQVFSNLIDNALKYLDSERPGIIRVTGRDEGDESVYCVEDNGIGIAKEHQSKIFEIFHRLNPGAVSGEGLGLSIIKKIMSRHNGRIWVESQPDTGSMFFVTLPGIK